MDSQAPLTSQLTKVLDTKTSRKKGLANFYMLVVEVSKMLNIPREQQEAVFGCMLEIIKKLAKVADAVDDYKRTEKREIKKLLKEVSEHGNPELILANDSSKLEAIVEEALSQGKSSLDVAVKVLRPLFGINLNTYGGGGKNVANSLRQNVPKELQERAKYLIALIESEEGRLTILKKFRDDQHYKNLGITALRADIKGNSEAPRMPGGQPVSEFLEVVYENLYTYLMDFLACAMYVQLPKGLGLAPEGERLSKKYRLAIEATLPPLPSAR